MRVMIHWTHEQIPRRTTGHAPRICYPRMYWSVVRCRAVSTQNRSVLVGLITRGAKALWALGIVVWAVVYIWVAGLVPANNNSVGLQWGIILLAGIVATVVMFAVYLAFFQRGHRRLRAKRYHPTFNLHHELAQHRPNSRKWHKVVALLD
jgi:hypothetical protein